MNKEKSLSPQLESIWLKASVLGGLWASVEIIIGSFFHNLRLPFAGTILAANATVLMIAFYQIWPEKGLIWRAGLIAALMKSISPSTVILGPMIGIMIEALILELFIRFFGNNIVSLAFAGALCVSSALIHRIASLLILYGFNIVTISLDIFHFIAKQIRMEYAKPLTVLLIACAFYFVFGITSAATGFIIGKRSKKLDFENQGFKPQPTDSLNILSINPNQQFSIFLFFIHLLVIPFGLLIMNLLSLIYAVSFVSFYSLFSIYKYKGSLRRLLKPVFWLQLLIIIFIASVNWKGINAGGSLMDKHGLLIGLEMTIRAIFVVIAFSSFSIELRNPQIRDILFRKGFDKIYSALGLAFTALPVMIEALPKPKIFLRNPVRSFSIMMLQAKEWLVVFEKKNNT